MTDYVPPSSTARGPVTAEILSDLRNESAALDDLVAALPASRWADPTPAAGWTIAHQIGHLLWTDQASLLSITDPDAFTAQLIVAEANSVDPGTGANRPGRIPPRPRHQPPGRRAIPAPQQGHLLHHLLSAIDGRAATTIPTTT